MIKISDGKISLLDAIVIDSNLPKHKKSKNEITIVNSPIITTSIRTSWNSVDEAPSTEDTTEPNRPSIWTRFKNLFKSKPKNPSRVFELILTDPTELALIKAKVEAYKALVMKAKDNGQTALSEKLADKAQVTIQEDRLLNAGFKKIVPETRMLEFIKGYRKNLFLTYLKNYVREIPNEVIAIKKKADELHIFDNYVVLHTDGTMVALTKKEKERDPILFGVIQNSRNFYYIGHWVDELCDLTFDAFIEKFGEKQLKLLEQIPLETKLADPTPDEGVATKQYVDEMISRTTTHFKEEND
jgi:hypothetical protein